jgi:DNA-binding CsgD family transcriptional regulator/Tfp pilus assembly protein PilF
LGRASVRLRTRDFDKAFEEVQTVLSFADRNSLKLLEARSLSLFSLLETSRGGSQQGLNLALKSYESFTELNRSNGRADAQLSSAMAYKASENWSQALRYYEDALQLKISSNDLSESTGIWIQIARCHLEMGNNELAESFFNQALHKTLANGQVLIRADAVEGLSTVYYEAGRYRQAFETQKTLLALRDSLNETERKAAVNKLEVQFETAKKEQEITVLQQERAIITNRWLTLALGLFLTIIIGVLVYDNQKRKHKQEKELLSTEDELRKAELKIMTDVLAHNQQRLSAYTENLLNKNNLVSQLERKLNELVENARTDTSAANELMVDFTNVRILTDEDWQEFKELFDGVHRGLREKLNAKYQNLTLAEQRLFLLMKLNMSTKQIANILGVSPESVKKARYRLKKKLSLNENVALQDFISSF